MSVVAVEVTRGMFKGETGIVMREADIGVLVRHSLSPIYKDGPRREPLDSWFSWSSLETLQPERSK